MDMNKRPNNLSEDSGNCFPVPPKKTLQAEVLTEVRDGSIALHPSDKSRLLLKKSEDGR